MTETNLDVKEEKTDKNKTNRQVKHTDKHKH